MEVVPILQVRSVTSDGRVSALYSWFTIQRKTQALGLWT